MIPKYSVKRPYTVLVAVVLVIVLGVVSLTRMTTDLLPAMNLPYVIVVTTDVGASPEEVEKDVTSPIEAAMATTSNINNVSSMSYDNYSMVVLEYEQSTNMDSAMIGDPAAAGSVDRTISGFSGHTNHYADRSGYDAGHDRIRRCGWNGSGRGI